MLEYSTTVPSSSGRSTAVVQNTCLSSRLLVASQPLAELRHTFRTLFKAETRWCAPLVFFLCSAGFKSLHSVAHSRTTTLSLSGLFG